MTPPHSTTPVHHRPLRHPALAALAVLWAIACSGSPPKLAEAPAVSGARCQEAASQNKPLVTEWSASDRIDLDAMVHQGGSVVVRYSGCKMELLRNCRAPGEYAYLAGTKQDERVTISNESELFTKLPLGATTFEAMVAGGKSIRVDMSIVGKYAAKDASVGSRELTGTGCSGATHVIVGLTTGAFETSAAASSSAGGGVSIVGAKSSSQSEVLRRGGKASSCLSATPEDKAPPESCSAFLRLELAPIQCSAGDERVDGKGCVSAATVGAQAARGGPTGSNDVDDDALAKLMLDASYALRSALLGGKFDPKFDVRFKGQEESVAKYKDAGFDMTTPLLLVVSSIRGSSPTATAGEAIKARFYFDVFPGGQLRWAGTRVERAPADGDGLGIFEEAAAGVRYGYQHAIRAIATPSCAMIPDVTAADLAQIPLTEKDRADLAKTLSQANPTPEGCANLKLAKGPWQSNQTRMYAVFGAASKTAVLYGVMEPGKSTIKIRDARVSFIGN